MTYIISSKDRNRRVVIMVWAGVLILSVSLPVAEAMKPGASHTVRELVEGATARREAIFAGTIEYVLTDGLAFEKEPISVSHHSYSRSGSNWVRRFPTTNQDIHVNVDGRLFEFVPVHDYNLLDNPIMHVGNPKSIEQAEQNYPGVFFLGTVCHSATAKFIKDNLDDCVLGEPEVVNGVKTIPVSWSVSADQVYSAFYGVPNPVRQGGVLRLYIAPQLGFAVPRATYETVDGFVATEFDAYNFDEVAPGIFFPRKASIQEYQPRPAYYQNYEIKKIEDINGEVLHQEFSIDIPAGTKVTYVVGRKEPINFTARKRFSTDDLNKALLRQVRP